jgi:hypothetical protein
MSRPDVTLVYEGRTYRVPDARVDATITVDHGFSTVNFPAVSWGDCAITIIGPHPKMPDWLATHAEVVP